MKYNHTVLGILFYISTILFGYPVDCKKAILIKRYYSL